MGVCRCSVSLLSSFSGAVSRCLALALSDCVRLWLSGSVRLCLVVWLWLSGSVRLCLVVSGSVYLAVSGCV